MISFFWQSVFSHQFGNKPWWMVCYTLCEWVLWISHRVIFTTSLFFYTIIGFGENYLACWGLWRTFGWKDFWHRSNFCRWITILLTGLIFLLYHYRIYPHQIASIVIVILKRWARFSLNSYLLFSIFFLKRRDKLLTFADYFF